MPHYGLQILKVSCDLGILDVNVVEIPWKYHAVDININNNNNNNDDDDDDDNSINNNNNNKNIFLSIEMVLIIVYLRLDHLKIDLIIRFHQLNTK
jgi:hypothetical protein